jgi:hypothetical protein
MPRLFAYVRLPTDCPSVQEYLAACEERLRAHAQEWLPGEEARVELFVEEARTRRRAFSRRPVANRLQRQLEPGDRVLILDSDLAFRDWADLLAVLRVWDARRVGYRLIDLGIDNETEEGREARALVEAFVNTAARRKVEATLEGRKRRRPGSLVNQYPGHCLKPAGARRRRRAVPDEHAQRAARRVVELRRAGLTFDRIYFRLLEEKITRRNGANGPGRPSSSCTPEKWSESEPRSQRQRDSQVEGRQSDEKSADERARQARTHADAAGPLRQG